MAGEYFGEEYAKDFQKDFYQKVYRVETLVLYYQERLDQKGKKKVTNNRQCFEKWRNSS